MPRSTKSVPRYRKHKASGHAVVTLNGRDYYLGPHGSVASRVEYDRLIAEWLANNRQLPPNEAPFPCLTINELILAYWHHVEGYYVKDGRPTSEQSNIKQAMKRLRRLYGLTVAAEFGPLALKTVRQTMIQDGYVRTSINKNIDRIKQMFRWATAEELVPATVYQGLRAVAGLKCGRTEAREPERVQPVADSLVDAIRAFVPRQVWAMIELQRLCGMRPGEVVIMRACDIDMDGDVWLYRPASHKTQHHGHERIVELGPRAQQTIKLFLQTDLAGYLFSPADVVAEIRAQRHRNRKTPLSCGNRPGSNRKTNPRCAPGAHYTTASYRRAITRAITTAFPHPELAKLRKCDLTPDQKEELRRWHKNYHWHPHQLRHTFGTRVRKAYGLETAKVLLGQRTLSATEVYAEIDRRKAADIMARIG